MIQRFSLPRRFAIAGAAIALLVATAVGALVVVRWHDQLLDLAQRNNVALAMAVSNGLADHYRDFVQSIHDLPPEKLAGHAEVAQIGAAVARLAERMPLWAAIQARISSIDFDFAGWADERWARATAMLDGPDFDAWLDAV